MHNARAEVLTLVTERTQVFMDVQTCKGETVNGLDVIYGYKNLKKDALLLRQNFSEMSNNYVVNV